MIIVAILGRSGSGKSTVEKALESIGFNRIISYTTRDLRAGETNHVEYHFVNRKQFEKLEESGVIIERGEYNGNLYGAPRPVGSDRNVIVVETDGLKKFREIYKNQVFAVYMNTPEDEINRRLNERNNTTDISSRKIEDENKFNDIESKVDFISNGMKQPIEIAIDIISEANKRGLI